MAKWTVKGADKATGADRSTTVTAETREGALRAGNDLGLAVEDVHPLVDRSSPTSEGLGSERLRERQRETHNPDFPAIVDGDAWARNLAAAIGVIGWFLSIPGVIVVAFAVVGLVARDKERAGLSDGTLWAITFAAATAVLSGVLFLALAAGLRLIGATAMAIRHIAMKA